MIRRPPRSTLSSSSAASDVYKRQVQMPTTYSRDQLLPLRASAAPLSHDQRLRITELGLRRRGCRAGNHTRRSQQAAHSVTSSTRCTATRGEIPVIIVHCLQTMISCSAVVVACGVEPSPLSVSVARRRHVDAAAAANRHLVVRHCAPYRSVDTWNCRPLQMRRVRPPHCRVASMNPHRLCMY